MLTPVDTPGTVLSMDTDTVIIATVTTTTTRTTTTRTTDVPTPADDPAPADIAALTAVLNAVRNARAKANIDLDQTPATDSYERGVLQGYSHGLSEAITEIRNAIACFTA